MVNMSKVEKFDPNWVARVSAGTWLQLPSGGITRIWHDTRSLEPGDLYVAIRGPRVDGHRLVAEAFEKGAVAALVDQAYADEQGKELAGPLLVVSETLVALGNIAAMHRHRVGAWITGITGSVGKTTVKDMTASLLGENGNTVRTRGNWNNHVGLPLSLLQLENDTQFGVFELGMNHPGEIAPLSAMLSPDWGIVTAVGPVHIEHFENVEAIAEEKAEILRALPKTGLAFLHLQDPYYSILSAAAPCPIRTVALGNAGDADLLIEGVRGQMLIRENGLDVCAEMPVPAPGKHNLLNAGFAILIAREAGMSWEQIQTGFSRYKPPAMRWEMQRCGSYTVINDAYNANPVSMQAALETFAQMQVQGRKWLVLGDMLELGAEAEERHRAVGKAVARGAWEGLAAVGIYAKTLRSAAIEAGYPEKKCAAFVSVDDVAGWLVPQLERNDAVLLKGSRGVALEKFLEIC